MYYVEKAGNVIMNLNYMISIIIPVYNVEAYVSVCIKSIVEQTYQNLQIIIVDDGSQDNSRSICEKYARQDSRILLIDQAHAGVSRARNNALCVVKGDYITFVDADDWLEPNACEVMLNEIILHKAEVVFCGYYKEQDGKKYHVAPRYTGVCNRKTMLRQTLIRGSYQAMAWAKMFDRKLVFQKGVPMMFDESLTNGEDGLWTWTVLSNAVCAYLDNTGLYHYRIRNDGANFNQTITVKRLSELEAYKKAYAILELVSPELLNEIKAKTFNTAHELRIKSYIQKNKKCEQICINVMKETARFFYSSSNFSIVYKVYHCVLSFFMAMHIPRKLLGKINNLITVVYDTVRL